MSPSFREDWNVAGADVLRVSLWCLGHRHPTASYRAYTSFATHPMVCEVQQSGGGYSVVTCLRERRCWMCPVCRAACCQQLRHTQPPVVCKLSRVQSERRPFLFARSCRIGRGRAEYKLPCELKSVSLRLFLATTSPSSRECCWNFVVGCRLPRFGIVFFQVEIFGVFPVRFIFGEAPRSALSLESESSSWSK